MNGGVGNLERPIKPLAEFAKTTPAADKGKMAKVLRDLNPVDLEKDARSYVSIKGGPMTAAIVIALDCTRAINAEAKRHHLASIPRCAAAPRNTGAERHSGRQV